MVDANINVEEASRLVSKMVLAAKNGKWSEVFPILDEKKYLINCIPEERAWAALHQAVWWNNMPNVQRLLKYPSCDSQVKTKQDRANESGPGKTAEDIARKKGFTDIAKFLKDFHDEHRESRFAGAIPTYVTAKDGERMDREGLPLLLLSLANYKKTFHPDSIIPHEAFSKILREVFDYMDHGPSHWLEIKKKVTSSLCAFDKNAADHLSAMNDHSPRTDSEKAFFIELVKLYTSNHVYSALNKALRREGQRGQYRPTGDDLALAPYALSLDVILFHWKELKPVSKTTYRRMKNMKDEDLKKYAKGTQFVWLSFVSSSLVKEAIEGFGDILFEISNDTPGAEHWQPRDISSISEISHEVEALYPVGVEFLVTDVRNRIIKLKLMNPA